MADGDTTARRDSGRGCGIIEGPADGRTVPESDHLVRVGSVTSGKSKSVSHKSESSVVTAVVESSQ